MLRSGPGGERIPPPCLDRSVLSLDLLMQAVSEAVGRQEGITSRVSWAFEGLAELNAYNTQKNKTE